MKLIGKNLSPFVRRVAISLNELEIPFEQEGVSVIQNPELIAPHNPLLRVPILVLDDGDSLIDSNAMLDYLDERVGAGRALLPASGLARREALQQLALAVGVVEKSVQAFTEQRIHDEDAVATHWLAHADGQIVSGLEALQAQLPAQNAYFGGERMNQVDITLGSAVGFVEVVRPDLNLAERLPKLNAYAERLEASAAFRKASIQH